MEIINRQARYDYFIEDEYECGIVLTGTEIKSVRAGKAGIKDSYVLVRNGEVFLINTYIAKYEEGNIFNHEERRSRKLLLHKKQIIKLKEKVEKEGYTIIPLKMYFKEGRLKVLIGVCKGKKLYDKKETIKQRDLEREIRKNLK